MIRHITIGSRSDNAICYPNPSVSRHHALLKMDNDIVTIEDLNSTNGTHINGISVKESVLRVNDKLELGELEVSVRDLFQKIKDLGVKNKTDFSTEYQALLQTFKEYRKKKIRISTPPKWPVIFRVILTILLISVWLMTDTIPRQYLFIFTLLIGLSAAIPSLFTESATLRNERLDNLKIGYEEILVCPKCRTSMINQSLSYWESRERCPNAQCDAVFKHKPN